VITGDCLLSCVKSAVFKYVLVHQPLQKTVTETVTDTSQNVETLTRNSVLLCYFQCYSKKQCSKLRTYAHCYVLLQYSIADRAFAFRTAGGM
jgi:hypothetical protein